MKPFGRDIRNTLIIKCCLLFFLWILCFKSDHKPVVDAKKWLLSSPTNINHQAKGDL
ncbi:MAG: cytochrome oxidase putative small subunit CydP [Legionella sp.]